MKILKKYLTFFYYFIILLGFLVEFQLTSVITTRRLSVIVALISIIMNWEKLRNVFMYINPKRYRLFICLFFICFVISLFHYMFSLSHYGGYTRYFELYYYLFIYLYVFVFSLYCAMSFYSFKSFATVWLSIIILEAGSVFWALSDNSVNILFNTLFAADERFEISAQNGSRIVGLGIMGSQGSVVLSTGVILLVLLRYKRAISQLLYYMLLVFIFTATLFVGRTGVIVEVVALIFGSLLNGKVKNMCMLTFAGITTLLWVSFIFQNLDSTIAERFQEWMMGAITKDTRESTINTVIGSGFSILNNSDLFFGLGIMRGNDGNGHFYRTDSGLLMTLMANGIVGFVCYYLAMLNLLLLPKMKIILKERLFFLLLIFISYFIEFKEAFFLKYIYAWFVLTIMFLWQDRRLPISDRRKLIKE